MGTTGNRRTPPTPVGDPNDVMLFEAQCMCDLTMTSSQYTDVAVQTAHKGGSCALLV